jgi:hypothetical protein
MSTSKEDPKAGDVVYDPDTGFTRIYIGGTSLPNFTATTTTSTSGTLTVPVEQKKPERKFVEFPRRVTKKVVIGFVEDNDEVVWGAKLKLLNFYVDFDSENGEGSITLVTDVEVVDA